MKLRWVFMSLASLGGVTGSDAECHHLVGMSGDEFHPIRVHVQYGTMEGSAAAQAYLRNTMIPHLQDWIEQAIRVRRSPLGVELHANVEDPRTGQINGFMCGTTLMNLGGPVGNYEDADLVLVVSLMVNCNGLYMAASPCATDACGRPTAANVMICAQDLNQTIGDTRGHADSHQGSLLHEMMHVLGFSTRLFDGFRVKETMLRRDVVRRDPILYTCQAQADGNFRVRWNVPGDTPGNLFQFHWPSRMVRAIDARGLRAADCRCPVDPDRVYTDEDIEYCIRHPNHCAIAVTSPKVVEKAREYYGCDEIQGQELENSVPDCRWVLQSHWKVRTLKGELMNWVVTEARSWVSPMTLALLEDSGWYEINYGMATAQIQTGSYGYKAGCPFALGRCINNGRPVDERVFCLPSESGRVSCSPDAHRLTTCYAPPQNEAGRALWRHRGVRAPRTFLPAYSYGIGRNQGLFGMDFCPVFETISACVFGAGRADSRCLESRTGATCVPISCSEDGSEYQVYDFQERCRREGQVLTESVISLVCRDPAVICADWNMVHLLPQSPFRRIPHSAPSSSDNQPNTGAVTSKTSGRNTGTKHKSGSVVQSTYLALLITVVLCM